MDAGFPKGGLEKLFAQYDRIVSRKPAMPDAIPNDEPPWKAPEEIPSPPITQAEHDEGMLKQNLGYDPEKSWRDVDADRMEQAEKKMNEHTQNPNGATFKQDEEGLTKAYNDETATGVYYDPDTRTEYVKGSTTARDWYDDLTKVPFWGDTKDSERYQQASKAYDDLTAQGKPVDRVVGHSLGGSVALEMQGQKYIPHSRTFGAPVLNAGFGATPERYRHPLDPVSIFDRGAAWGKLKPYSHSYTDFEDFDNQVM